jgi:hypothetical protein
MGYIFSNEKINLKNKNDFLKSKQYIISNPYLEIERYDVTKKTKENYCYYVNVLRRMFKHEFPELDEEERFCTLLNFRKTDELIDKHFSEKHAGIYKNILIFLCKFFNTPQHQQIHDLYSEKMNFVNEKHLERRNQNLKSEKEEQNWVSFQEIENYFEECACNLIGLEHLLKLQKKKLNLKLKKNLFYKGKRKQFEKQFQELIMLASYVLCPPVRNDWHAVKVKNIDKEKDNYLDFTDEKKREAHLVLNNYKTHKIYGKLEIPLTKRFSDLIHKFLAIKKENEVELWDDDNDYLFESTYKKRISNNNNACISGTDFSKHLTRILKKKFPEKQINIQMIRKIYTTNSRNFESVQKAKEISKVMGHSYKEHLLYFKTKTPEELKKDREEKLFKTEMEIIQYLNLEENKYRFKFNEEKKEWELKL